MAQIDDFLTRGFQERQRDMPEEALRWFRKASELEPDDPAIRLEIARCYFDLAERQNGIGVLDVLKVGSSSEADAELLLELARLWVRAGEPERALRLYRSIPVDNHSAPQAILEAVLLLERTHNLQDARIELERHPCIPLRGRSRGRKSHLTAALALSVLLERSGDLDSAASRLKRAWKEASPSSGLAIECGYRLARLLDKLDQPDAALQTLKRCKKVERQQMPLDLLKQHVCDRRASDLAVLEELPDDWFDSRAAVNRSERAIVLGHPRSGTSLLSRHLSCLTQATWIDESPAFSVIARQYGRLHASPSQSFAGYLQSLSDEVVANFESVYVDRMRQQMPLNGIENSSNDFIRTSKLIDKNPGLSNSLPALTRLLPGSAWIYVERDPRDVAVSCYFQRFGATPLGWACLMPGGALEAVFHTASLWAIVRARLNRGQTIVVRYEDLVDDPNSVMATIAQRLGWPGDGKEAVEPTIIHSPTYADVRRPVNSLAVGRWHRHEQAFGSITEVQRQLLHELKYD